MSLPVFTIANEMRAWTRAQKKRDLTVAFVPTMGYLHEGHISLVHAARKFADVVVASIYVNPTQFSANEDFDVYPRNADGDREKLREAGAAAIFEPNTLYYQVPGVQGDGGNVVGREDNHPDSHETFVQVERLQRPLCGKSRPHFFRGVATVVTKLFHIVEPDVAVFGRKDYQQWRVITRMVRDLDFPIKIVGEPICREPDGLAMSSRNARLSPQARKDALCIQKALKAVQERFDAGSLSKPHEIPALIEPMITAAGGRVDYIEVADADHLGEVQDLKTGRPVLVAIAAHFPAKDKGTVRLIDNMVLGGELPNQ